MVEYIVAIDVIRVRFAAGAIFCALQNFSAPKYLGPFRLCCQRSRKSGGPKCRTGAKKCRNIFVGGLGWSKIDLVHEEESIPRVWDDLASFLMTYDANKIGAIWGQCFAIWGNLCIVSTVTMQRLKFTFKCLFWYHSSTSGLMVEYIVAIDVIRVRFAAGAICFFSLMVQFFQTTQTWWGQFGGHVSQVFYSNVTT